MANAMGAITEVQDIPAGSGFASSLNSSSNTRSAPQAWADVNAKRRFWSNGQRWPHGQLRRRDSSRRSWPQKIAPAPLDAGAAGHRITGAALAPVAIFAARGKASLRSLRSDAVVRYTASGAPVQCRRQCRRHETPAPAIVFAGAGGNWFSVGTPAPAIAFAVARSEAPNYGRRGGASGSGP